MDVEGIRQLYEQKRGRPCNAAELAVLARLTVRDCVRIWDNLAFVTDTDFDLATYVPIASAVTVELTPQRKAILSDIKKLREALSRIGAVDPKDTKFKYKRATFRQLREDTKLKGQLDSVAGTCRLARKEGLVFFDSRDLIIGQHDDVKIVLIDTPEELIGPSSSEPKLLLRKSSVPGAPRPVTNKEVDDLVSALAAIAVDKMGKRKAKFSAVVSHLGPAVLADTAHLNETCKEAKKRGRIAFPTDELVVGKDDNVYVEMCS